MMIHMRGSENRETTSNQHDRNKYSSQIFILYFVIVWKKNYDSDLLRKEVIEDSRNSCT